jgi:hypothetical protein
MKMKAKRVFLTTVIVSLLLSSFLPMAYAATVELGIPDPSNTTDVTVLPAPQNVTVDGDPSEWDYNPADPTNNAWWAATMYTGWDPTKPALANVYLGYDCDTQIMYVFVRTLDTLPVDQDMATTWIAEGDVSNKITFIDFAWVYSGSTAVGWEASFSFPEGSNSPVLVHTNVQAQTAGTGTWLMLYPSCPPPTAIGLTSFAARGSARSIELRWETASEIGNLGFNLYRAGSADGPWTRLNASLIPSQVAPGSPVGAVYTYVDVVPRRVAPYYYRLETVDMYGQTQSYGPVSASLQMLRLSPARPRLQAGLSSK